MEALESLGLPSFRAVLEMRNHVPAANALPEAQRMAFLHVTSEALRVQEAVAAMRESNFAAFGKLLNASHASLRDRLRVSSPALDALVDAALTPVRKALASPEPVSAAVSLSCVRRQAGTVFGKGLCEISIRNAAASIRPTICLRRSRRREL